MTDISTTTSTTTATPTARPAATLDSRLATLELQVIGGGGKNTLSSSSASSSTFTAAAAAAADDDLLLSTRLTNLQKRVEQHHASVRLKDTWRESQRLLKELDPGLALTHNPQHQPVLYKRQQVLAAATQLRHDLTHLDVLRDMLSTSVKEVEEEEMGGKSSSLLRLDRVVQAPILTCPRYVISARHQERLDKLRCTCHDLQQRTQVLQSRLQTMMECYYTTLTAVSTKCILANETIQQQEQQQQEEEEQNQTQKA